MMDPGGMGLTNLVLHQFDIVPPGVCSCLTCSFSLRARWPVFLIAVKEDLVVPPRADLRLCSFLFFAIAFTVDLLLRLDAKLYSMPFDMRATCPPSSFLTFGDNWLQPRLLIKNRQCHIRRNGRARNSKLLATLLVVRPD